jgi:hypothetical protein
MIEIAQNWEAIRMYMFMYCYRVIRYKFAVTLRLFRIASVLGKKVIEFPTNQGCSLTLISINIIYFKCIQFMFPAS